MIGKRKMTKSGEVCRSGFEKKILEWLVSIKTKYEYEPFKIKYSVPARAATYTPDVVLPNGIIIELKGRFTAVDRKKHLLIQEQRPDLDIRFVFMRAATKLSKASNTTYGMWASKNGFIYADKEIPTCWIKEKAKNGNS